MSIEAMKQLIELYDKHCYNNDYGGIEFNKKHGYKFIEAIEALRAAIQQAEAQQPATPEPVAWLYIEDGEVRFGHPNGYRPADARPLVFGDTLPAPSVPDDVRHIVGWWLCNEANPQDGSPWMIEPSQRVLDHMKVVYGEKHTVMRLVAIDAAMLAAKDASA